MVKKETLVFSIALEGYSKLFESCIQTQRNYCSRWGFTYLLVDEAPRRLLPAEAAWLKLFLLKAALDNEYKWIAFIDADCEIRDHTPSFIEEMAKFQDHKSIFMGSGFSGRINSGVIFMKNSAEALGFLEKVIKNGDEGVPDEDKALYENGHIIHYGKGNPHVQIIDSQKWNNNTSFDKTSYIQHYSGRKLRGLILDQRSTPKKKSLFNRMSGKIKTKFRFKKKTPTMQRISSLLPFYLKKYNAFGMSK